MSLFQRFLALFGHGPNVRRDLLLRAKIEHALSRRWPDPAHCPLPRGAIVRIAEEVGCSRGYAHRIARSLGYHQEGKA